MGLLGLLRYRHREHTALNTVGTVPSCDLAMMHLDNHLAEVQTDTCALTTCCLIAGRLVETGEQMRNVGLVETRATVGDTYIYGFTIWLRIVLIISKL